MQTHEVLIGLQYQFRKQLEKHRLLPGKSCRTINSGDLCAIPHKVKLCAETDIATLRRIAHNIGMNDLARTPKQIGNTIRRARKARGWSQTVLGQKSNMRQETISLIENGNPAARIDTILNILAALDLELRIHPRSQGSSSDIEDIF